MKYQDAAAFRQALEQRLKDLADGDGARLSRYRKRVVFERLLARLASVAENQWLLKGGFALDLRLAERARSTRDVDIEWQAAREELLDVLLNATSHDAGDFLIYSIERAGVPEDHLGGSHRFRVSVSLAGRQFEGFVLDVGFQLDDESAVDILHTSELLVFAGIDAVEVDAVPLERQVAEKLHAYTRTYEDGRPSTRPKDLVDLVLISEISRLDAAALRRAIDEVFASRATHAAPDALPPPPSGWERPFRRLAGEVGIPDGLAAGHHAAARLLDPVLSGAVVSGHWNSFQKHWESW